MKADQPHGREKLFAPLGLIGKGEMAEVHRCRMSNPGGLEKLVALKRLLPQWARDPSAAADFADEARVAALLSHENIVQVYDFTEINGQCHLVMEYLAGQNLEVVMQRAEAVAGGMPHALALFVAAGICAGMEHAHAAKDLRQRPLHLVHRELSPDNIVITCDGRVKIVDFGCARVDVCDDRMRMGMTKGKIAYMAPEQLVNADIDQRADIFAIGILLYEMLSGRRMYSGEPAVMIEKCRKVEYERLENIRGRLSPAVYAIVDRALQPDRNLRYPSCGTMLEDLDACLAAIQPLPNSRLLAQFICRLFADNLEEDQPRRVRVPPAIRAEEGKAGSPVSAAVRQPGQARAVPRRLRPWVSLAAGGIGVLLLFFIFSSEVGREDMREKTETMPEFPLQVVAGSTSAPSSPEPQPAATPEAPPQEGATSAALSEQQEKPLEPPAKRSASQESTRARKIDEFLAKAAEAWKEKRLTEPEQECAFWFYSRILALDPKNAKAWEGIDRIGKYFVDQAEEALTDRRFQEAERNVQRGLQVFPDNRRLLALLEGMEERKRQHIADLAVRAEQALRRDDLTTPVEAAAYTYYKKILKLDKRNDAALAGIGRIADRYAELAEDAYRNLKLANCREFVRSGLSVAPHHPKLLELQADLDRSMPGIFLKSLEKSLSSMFE